MDEELLKSSGLIKTEETPNVVPVTELPTEIDIAPNQVPIKRYSELIPDPSAEFNQIGSRLFPVAKTISLSPGTGTDFTDAQHDHADAFGGGQLNPSTALASAVPVSKGGSGAATLTGILKGNGTSAFTTITPLAGTKVYYVSDSSGGAVTRKLTFTDGILTSET